MYTIQNKIVIWYCSGRHDVWVPHPRGLTLQSLYFISYYEPNNISKGDKKSDFVQTQVEIRIGFIKNDIFQPFRSRTPDAMRVDFRAKLAFKALRLLDLGPTSLDRPKWDRSYSLTDASRVVCLRAYSNQERKGTYSLALRIFGLYRFDRYFLFVPWLNIQRP